MPLSMWCAGSALLAAFRRWIRLICSPLRQAMVPGTTAHGLLPCQLPFACWSWPAVIGILWQGWRGLRLGELTHATGLALIAACAESLAPRADVPAAVRDRPGPPAAGRNRPNLLRSGWRRTPAPVA